MKLKELNLISFGKFKNKKIELEDGLNILYGENESGKTTIHNFIEGMFYGFLKPYASRRNFLPELNKYRPWQHEQYAGTLSLEKENKVYRVERDFNKEKIKVYEELTAKDITADIDTGEKLKIHLPGLYFFDFNCLVYRNTIAIKQLGNKVDSDLSKEVKDKLANISTSLDDEISVKSAISSLEKELEDIGTERAYTRPYGKAVKRLNMLKERRKEYLEKQYEYNQTAEIYVKLKEEIEEKNAKILELKSILHKAKILDMKKTYDEAMKLKYEIRGIEEQIEVFKPYASLSTEDYQLSVQINSDIRILIREIEDLMTRIKTISIKIEELNIQSSGKAINGMESNRLYDDYLRYNQLEEEKGSLLMDNRQNKIDILNSELKGIKEKKQKTKVQFTLSLIITAVFLGFFIVNSYLSALAIIPGVFAIYSISKGNKLKIEAESLDERVKKLELEENEVKEKVSNIEKHMTEILRRYNCSSKAELSRVYDDMRFVLASRDSMLKQIDELNKEKEEANANLEEKKNNKTKLSSRLKEIMSRNSFNSINGFKEGLDKKRKYDILIKDKESKIELLRRTLGNTSLKEIEEKLKAYDKSYFEGSKETNIESITEKLKNYETELSSMKDEHSRLEERIENLNRYVKELVNIEEDIVRTENQIITMDEKIEAIKIAKKAIEDISEKIHNQFAPKINKDISELINVITDGRYTNIRIDDNLAISVENPSTNEIVSLDSLSGGTIDQIHFALRFSIINAMKNENLPLILDDCFVQYDEQRLENILKFLDKIGDKVQILLFTCQNREKEILDRLNLKHNLINLS